MIIEAVAVCQTAPVEDHLGFVAFQLNRSPLDPFIIRVARVAGAEFILLVYLSGMRMTVMTVMTVISPVFIGFHS